MDPDRLIDDYLRRLEDAAAHMQKSRRAELVAEIRGHIDAALRKEQVAGEVAVRNVLDRLGPPEDIVEAAQPTPVADQRTGKLEIAALIALVIVPMIVPFIGWLVGAVLVFSSRVWSSRDKLIGALLLIAPIVLLGLSAVATGPSGGEDSIPPGDSRPVGEKVEDPLIGTLRACALRDWCTERSLPGMAVAPGSDRESDRIRQRVIT